MIQFFVYDAGKLAWLSGAAPREFTGSEAFLLGAFSKAVATVCTYPLQVAQTRLRVATDKTMLECLADVVAEQGWQGLYVGIYPKLTQTCSTAAFMFLFYEKLLSSIVHVRRARLWAEVAQEGTMSIAQAVKSSSGSESY